MLRPRATESRQGIGRRERHSRRFDAGLGGICRWRTRIVDRRLHVAKGPRGRPSWVGVTGFDAEKINIGALGNIVPQLHVHHIARYKDDAAWPGPVWGAVEAITYKDNERAQIIDKLKHHLTKDFTFVV